MPIVSVGGIHAIKAHARFHGPIKRPSPCNIGTGVTFNGAIQILQHRGRFALGIRADRVHTHAKMGGALLIDDQLNRLIEFGNAEMGPGIQIDVPHAGRSTLRQRIIRPLIFWHLKAEI